MGRHQQERVRAQPYQLEMQKLRVQKPLQQVARERNAVMTKAEKERYEPTDVLREYLQQLKYRKFRLDCGGHVTFGYHLGNDITIRNGKRLKIICSLCGY
jgi:hypothetical protein